MKRYTKEGRLSDVIALISLLSVDKYAFRKIEHLQPALRAAPMSITSKKWEDIAGEHPEFFRFNGDKSSVALLIRSYFPEDSEGRREVIKVPETQKLIDTAIALHDKEIARKQRNAYLFSFLGSLIVAVIAVSGTIFSAIYNNKGNNTTNAKIDSLTIKVQRIDNKIH